MVLRVNKNEKKYLIYILFSAAIFCMHLPMAYFNDDLSFLRSMESTGLPGYLLSRFYENGKILTDGLAGVFLQLPMMVWKVFDTVVYLLIAVLIVRNFTEGTWQDTLTVCLLLWLFPFWYLSTAGWIATTANYLYPVLGLLTVIDLLRGMQSGKRIRVWKYLLSGLAIVYAANQDQAAAILIGGLLLYLCYAVFTKADKKSIFRIAAVLLFSLASYLILFFLPGHINRMSDTAEMERWLPEYANWSLLTKLYHGYTSTVACLFFHDVKLFDLFCLLLFLLSVTTPGVIPKIAGGVPLGAILVIHLIGQDKFVIYPSYAGGMPELLPLSCGWKAAAVLLLTLLVIGCGVFTICKCVKDRGKKWLLLLLLVLSAGSREMMCLSATLYASHARTFTYLVYGLLLCDLIILNELRQRNKSIWYIGLGCDIGMLLHAASPLVLQDYIL